jgi:hypothetical protein
VIADRAISTQSTAAGAPTGHQAGCAATTGGTAVAVAAVPLPERRNHEAQQQLELKGSDTGGGVPTLPPLRTMRWLP